MPNVPCLSCPFPGWGGEVLNLGSHSMIGKFFNFFFPECYLTVLLPDLDLGGHLSHLMEYFCSLEEGRTQSRNRGQVFIRLSHGSPPKLTEPINFQTC